MGRVRTIRGLGDDTGIDPAFWNVSAQLHTARAQLDDLEAQVRSNSNVAVAIGRDVAQLEQKYGDLVSRYQYAYTLITGAPDTGLGIAPLALAGVIAFIIAAAAALLYEIGQMFQKASDARRQDAITQTAAGLVTQGRFEQAMALFGLNQPNALKWLQDNWPVLAIAAGAYLFATR